MDNQTYQQDDVTGQQGPSCSNGITTDRTGEDALLIKAYNGALNTESAATFQNLNVSEIHQTSPGKIEQFCEDHCGLFLYIFKKYICASVTECLACVATTVSLVVPAIMLPIGIVYRDKCTVQPMVPVYLIIGGGAAIVCIAVPLLVKAYMCRCARKVRRIFYYLSRISLLVSVIAQIAWWFAGGYWVFSVYHVYQSHDYRRHNYCNDVLYTFSFWFLIISYITLPVTVGILLYLICIAKVIKLRPRREEHDQADEIENAESDKT